jgi:glycosyltransferase involved in cell wall biosynthesis
MDSQNHLNVYIDGMGRGGAETLLAQLLPLLGPYFKEINIHSFNGSFELEDKFSEHFIVYKHSMFSMIKHILTDQNILYVNLAKCSLISFFVILLKNLFGKTSNFTIHLHTTLKFYNLKNKNLLKCFFSIIYIFMLKIVFINRACKFVVSSDQQKEEMIRLVKGRISCDSCLLIMPNTFSKDYIQFLKQTRINCSNGKTLQKNKLVFFTLSRLISIKQIHWAIQAVYETAISYPSIDVFIFVYGTGPEKDFLQNYINKLAPLPNFNAKLCGFIDTLATPLSMSDIYLFPSELEGSPLTLAEAALSGICCISNDCLNGPKFLSKYFPNIFLVSPPTLKNFIATTLSKAREFINDEQQHVEGFHNKNSFLPWPTLEQSAEVLSQFLVQTTFKDSDI